MRLPNFIIAGAARSGTSWLCHLLDRHPDIALAQPIAPEPKFFLVDALFARGLAYYSQRWFADRHERLLGEKSTNYMDDPRVAGRIAAALPEVRLIFILRDPVDRTFANYRWSRKNGHETLDFATAIACEGQRHVDAKLIYARPFDYLSRSCYAARLKPYLDEFGLDRILLLRFEDIPSAPGSLASRLHRFLGVVERPGDAEGLGTVNGGDADNMPPDVRDGLVVYFAQPNLDLARLTGFDVSGWSSAAVKLDEADGA